MKHRVGIAVAAAVLAAGVAGGTGFAAGGGSSARCNNLAGNVGLARHRVGTGSTAAQNKRLAKAANNAEQRYLKQCIF